MLTVALQPRLWLPSHPEGTPFYFQVLAVDVDAKSPYYNCKTLQADVDIEPADNTPLESRISAGRWTFVIWIRIPGSCKRGIMLPDIDVEGSGLFRLRYTLYNFPNHPNDEPKEPPLLASVLTDTVNPHYKLQPDDEKETATMVKLLDANGIIFSRPTPCPPQMLRYRQSTKKRRRRDSGLVDAGKNKK